MKSLLSDTSSRIFCLASRVAMAVAFIPAPCSSRTVGCAIHSRDSIGSGAIIFAAG